MLQKLHSLNPFANKTTPAPIAQPTIQERVSKTVQECFTKIRASIACLCCVKPMQKKVVVQQSKISQIAQSALQIASEHKKKTIAAAIVGAANGVAYFNYQNPCALQKIFNQIRSCFSEQTPVSNPMPTYLPLITGTGCVAAIALISYLSYKKTNTIAPNDLEETSTKISKKEDVRIALIPSIISADPLLVVLQDKKYSRLLNATKRLIIKGTNNIDMLSSVSIFIKMDSFDIATVLSRLDAPVAHTLLSQLESKSNPKKKAAVLKHMQRNSLDAYNAIDTIIQGAEKR
ncbi:MAG: hypothetical protein RLZZ453_861 [Chlamydiota bacterium]|jgi:hypothetical protein